MNFKNVQCPHSVQIWQYFVFYEIMKVKANEEVCTERQYIYYDGMHGMVLFFFHLFFKEKRISYIDKSNVYIKIKLIVTVRFKSNFSFFLNIELKTPIITKSLLLFYFNCFLVYVERRTFSSLSVLLMSRNFHSLTLHRQQVKTN